MEQKLKKDPTSENMDLKTIQRKIKNHKETITNTKKNMKRK